jgi:hypothetical protein
MNMQSPRTRCSIALTAAALALAVALAGCNVDETGYFVPPEVSYSAPEQLEPDEDEAVLVIGAPGALEQGGGELTVANLRTGQVGIGVVDPEVRSFAARVQARLGDEVVLRYRLGEQRDELAVALEDDLGQVAAPECLICAGNLVSPPDQDGQVTVALEMLDDPTPPFLVVNSASGAALLAGAVSPAPRLPAEAGDVVCVIRQSAARDRSSTSVCEAVPAP